MTTLDKVITGLGIALFAIALALLMLGEIDIVIILALFVGGLIGLISGLYKYLGYKEGTDERTRKLSAFAATYSWLITFALVCILILLDYFGRLNMNIAQTLGLIFFVMLVTMLWFNMYFKRRGDVD